MSRTFIPRSLIYVCAGLAVWFIACFLFAAIQSLFYPFHLEWMEGHMLDTVQRVLEGKAIYAKPSLEFIPYLYTPYYYYVVAFFSLIFGLDFFGGRLVSLLSILGVAFIIYAWVRREDGTRIHGIIATGLLFSTYLLSGRWFDVARVDSLFLYLTLGGIYWLYFMRGAENRFIAASLLAMAFFTKQTALVIAFPVFAALLATDTKHSIFTGLILAAEVLAGLALLHFSTHGWSSFYLLELPSAHHFDDRYIVSFWTTHIFASQIIVAAFSCLFLYFAFRENWRKGVNYMGIFSGLILGSYLMRINAWSYINVYIPLYIAYALLAGLSLRYAASKPALVQMIWYGLIAAHFLSLLYDPLKLLPSEASKKQGEAFLESLSQVEGEIFMPDLQFVQTRIGKKSYAFGMAAFDLLHTDLKEKNHLKDELRAELDTALLQKRFAAIAPGKVTKLHEKYGNYHLSKALYYPTEYITGIIRPSEMELYLANP